MASNNNNQQAEAFFNLLRSMYDIAGAHIPPSSPEGHPPPPYGPFMGPGWFGSYDPQMRGGFDDEWHEEGEGRRDRRSRPNMRQQESGDTAADEEMREPATPTSDVDSDPELLEVMPEKADGQHTSRTATPDIPDPRGPTPAHGRRGHLRGCGRGRGGRGRGGHGRGRGGHGPGGPFGPGGPSGPGGPFGPGFPFDHRGPFGPGFPFDHGAGPWGRGPHGRGGHGHGPHGPHRRGPGHEMPGRGGRPPFDMSALLRNLGDHPWARGLREYANTNGFGHIFNAGPGAGVDVRSSMLGNDVDSFEPPIDLFSTPDSWVLHVALPGVKKEDVGLNWDTDKSELSISGVVHRGGDEAFISGLLSSERRVGAFERKVQLPPVTESEPDREAFEVDGDAISAKLNDGILVINVPKYERLREWTDVKKINIL